MTKKKPTTKSLFRIFCHPRHISSKHSKSLSESKILPKQEEENENDKLGMEPLTLEMQTNLLSSFHQWTLVALLELSNISEAQALIPPKAELGRRIAAFEALLFLAKVPSIPHAVISVLTTTSSQVNLGLSLRRLPSTQPLEKP